MNAAERRRLLLGAGIVLGFAGLFVLFFVGTIPRLLSGGSRDVRASFASVGTLNVGEPVRIDGLTAGKVEEIEADGEAGSLVTLRLIGDPGRLYANARANIRWRTALGGANAVELDRGTAGLPELGGRVIPRSRTSNQVEVDEIVGTLRQGQRAGIKTLAHEGGRVFADPEQPGGVLKALEEHGRDIAVGLDTLRGRHRDADLARLVRNGGAAMRALEAPQQRLRSVLQNAATTLGVTADREQDLRRLVRDLATVQPRLRGSLDAVGATLARATPLLEDLRDPVRQIAPTLRSLRPVVGDADRLLTRQARPLLLSLRPTADALRKTARQAVPLIDEITPSLDRLEQSILPDLAKRSPESRRTTYEMLGPAISGLQGAASHFDKDGYYVRLLGSGGGHVYDGLPCQANFTDPSSEAYLRCTSFSKALGALFGTRPDAAKSGRRR